MIAFELCIPIILVNEGGSQYTNKIGDKGGPTRYGITLQTLSGYRKKPCAADDVRNLSETEAKAIYRQNYWAPIKAEQMPTRALATAFLDAAVLTGPLAAAKMMQRAVGAVDDGIVGPKTLAAIKAQAEGKTLSAYVANLSDYYVTIATRDPTQQVWLVPWLKRAATMRAMPFMLT